MSGLGNSSDKCSKIVVTPSLLMRLFEWCHEDAANDVAMHKVFEKIIAFTDGVNPLNMDVYDAIIANANDGQEKDSEEENDCPDSNTEGYYDTCCAEPYDMKYCCHGYDTPYAYGDCSYPDPNTCCHTYTVDYNDVDTYYKPFGNDMYNQYDGQPTTITIDCAKDETACEDCPQQDVMTPEIEQQMMQAFKNAQG